MKVHEATRETEITFPLWSAAEFLDVPVSGLVVRALICRLGHSKWQWSILSIERDGEGRLICAGVEKSVGDARLTAASEIDKCVQEPFA